jgi:hypothetical protein
VREKRGGWGAFLAALSLRRQCAVRTVINGVSPRCVCVLVRPPSSFLPLHLHRSRSFLLSTMKIFKDAFNGDELMSDSYPTVTLDDLIYEVETKTVSRSKVGNIDIGANPSAEEGAEDEGADGDSDAVTVNNLVDAHNLVVCACMCDGRVMAWDGVGGR